MDIYSLLNLVNRLLSEVIRSDLIINQHRSTLKAEEIISQHCGNTSVVLRRRDDLGSWDLRLLNSAGISHRMHRGISVAASQIPHRGSMARLPYAWSYEQTDRNNSIYPCLGFRMCCQSIWLVEPEIRMFTDGYMDIRIWRREESTFV